MAIKGVSDVVRLPRLGKIRLGIKKESGSGISYPSPTDYFVCPEEVRKVFGEKPKELRIMFPTEDESQWASQYLKCYSASRGLICRGDGETAVARVDIRTGEIATRDTIDTELREIGCHPDTCPHYQRGQCRRVMNLQFLLPDCPGFGVYQLDTSSFHSIVNINSSLKLIRGICQRLSMIPLSLKLVEQEVQPEGKRKTVRVLSLTAPYTLAEIQRYAQTPPGQVLLLPPPDNEAPDDLFPDEILEDIPSIDEELLQAWERARSKVKELDIKDVQVGKWFNSHYQLDVSLNDFGSPVPPDKFTVEQLMRFVDSLTLYEEKLKQKRLFNP
ncbi:hypothetical protein M1N05_01555 [Dehalococcoidales bacterium]|nr:hypothetical protein [Dehalococcoidales bacterium]